MVCVVLNIGACVVSASRPKVKLLGESLTPLIQEIVRLENITKTNTRLHDVVHVCGGAVNRIPRMLVT